MPSKVRAFGKKFLFYYHFLRIFFSFLRNEHNTIIFFFMLSLEKGHSLVDIVVITFFWMSPKIKVIYITSMRILAGTLTPKS